MSEQLTIAIIGLSYGGLPLAVGFGKRRPVIGFNIKEDRIKELRAGYDNTREVERDELAEAKRLTFSLNADDLRAASIFIVTVPTPINRHKRPDLIPLIRRPRRWGRCSSREI